MSNGEEKEGFVLEFSGKQKDFLMWSKKFLAKAKTKGWKEVILGKFQSLEIQRT